LYLLFFIKRSAGYKYFKAEMVLSTGGLVTKHSPQTPVDGKGLLQILQHEEIIGISPRQS
jgi:hypothetical protein